MQQLTIYHNPRCSKSRQTLDILMNLKLNPVIVDYIKNPLSREELTALSEHFSLEDFVRSNEAAFKDLNLNLTNKAAIIDAMTKEPKLMQRPIVTYKGKAIIGRPPEKVMELLS